MLIYLILSRLIITKTGANASVFAFDFTLR